ncbi:uncharacterized protein LOC135491617 [Lineus longissimus]|uniref:uncharacterized protein LOC135491617 n=1 Tax=Lineus longissimus TaxID=88925 RepID=UPI00315D3CCE
MAPVSDVMGDGTKDDEISQEEIDDFLAASSDSDEEDQSDAGITVTCADSTTCLFDSVDGDPHTLQRPTANHGPATATKDAVSQEDIDAFLADDSDSDSEFTGVTNNRGNTNEKERSETGSPNSGRDAISQDDIDDFLADCTDTEDDVPNMDVVKPSGGQGAASAEIAVGQGARTDKLEATSTGTSAPAAAGSSVDPVEESLEEKMIRMQVEMDRMKKLLDKQQQEKLQTQEKSPATKKRVSFGQVETKRLREAETDLFSSPSESKTSKDSNQSTKNRQSKEPSPECSGMAAGHRKINAKGITKEDASKIVGPLTFYKKEEVRPADDSGSDWDDMDGEKPYLSKEGRDIKKMLSGDRRRVAHTPKYESGEIRKRKDTWMGKSSSASHQPPVRGESSQGAKTAKKEFEDSDYMKERYSGIRIINPLISNAVMKMRMEKRRMIKMSELSLTSKNYLNDCDWVTIGVLVSKSDTRKSSNVSKVTAIDARLTQMLQNPFLSSTARCWAVASSAVVSSIWVVI